MNRFKGNSPKIAFAVLAGFVLSMPAAHAVGPVQLAAAAGETQQLENIVVTGDKPATAPYEAPTQGSLDSGEPQSIINQHFIENNASPAANYTDIINVSPSVVDTTPNGRGLAESLNLSIRGLQDGQFNVTFDGVPWGDSNDFTHHSTSYFTADTIGKVVVDRGPGTAAQIGNATFGGTVALQSKDPMITHNMNVSASVGTWRSNDYSAQYDSGAIAGAGNGRMMVTLTSINSDGAMSNNSLNRKNAFLKYVQPVSADTTVSAVLMYNTLHQNVAQMGTSRSNLALYGPSYSMSDIPSSDSYYGYNYDDIHTDFEYIDVKTVWSGVHVDNKLYSYAYYHKINETNDISIAQGSLGLYDGTPGIPGANPNDVAGQKGFNNYRSVGDIIRAEMDLGPGSARAGLWYDYQWNDRCLTDVDWTLGGITDPNTVDGSGSYLGVQRLIHNDLRTLSPFVEYEYRPIESLSITPGVRYTSFTRDFNATVNQNVFGALDTSKTWNGVQPSVYALYHVSSSWSAYAQAARGFLAPVANVFYKSAGSVALASLTSQSPETTMNYQVGTTWKSSALTLAADLYHIDFSNFVSTHVNASGFVDAALSHAGGATFNGEEFEGTYAVGEGFSVYGNISHNGSGYKDGSPIYNAPSGISAVGVIFDRGPLYASVISKHVGSTVQQGYAANETVSGYTVNDLAFAYTMHAPENGLRNLKLKFAVSNFSNNRSIYYLYNGSNLSQTQDYVMTLPGRAYTLGFSADF